MGFWSRARDYVEEKVDRAKEYVHDKYEPRERGVENRARREYSDRVAETVQKANRGDISRDLASRRVKRAKERFLRKKVPVEKRASKAFARAAIGAADVVYNPSGRGFDKKPQYAKRIASGRKATYDMVRGTSSSYNKNVPSAFGLGTGKGKRRGQDKSNWSMLTGSKGSGGGGQIGGGFGMLYGPSASRGSGRRKKRGGGGSGPSDTFWMLGG